MTKFHRWWQAIDRTASRITAKLCWWLFRLGIIATYTEHHDHDHDHVWVTDVSLRGRRAYILGIEQDRRP